MNSQNTPPPIEEAPLLTPSSKFLLGVISVLGLACWFILREPPPDISGVVRPFDFNAKNALTLEIERPGMKVPRLVFEKRKLEKPVNPEDPESIYLWTLTKPFEERASGSAVVQFLSQMGYMEAEQVLKGKALSDAKDLGFEKPKFTVKVTRSGAADIVFLLGNELPGQSYPLKIQGQDEKVYIVKPSFVEKLKRPLSEYRYRKLFAGVFRDLTQLQVRVREGAFKSLKTRQLTLVKDQNFWRLENAQGPYADRPNIEDLHDGIYYLNVARVLDGVFWDATSQAKFGLTEPAMVIQTKTAARTEVLKIGNAVPGETIGSLKQHYAQFNDRKAVYTVNLQKIEKLLTKTPEEYQSKLLLQLGGVPIEYVKATVPGQAAQKLFREGRLWAIEGQAEAKIDQTRVKNLLELLKSTQIDGFLDKTEDSPVRVEFEVKAGPYIRTLKVRDSAQSRPDKLLYTVSRPKLRPVTVRLPYFKELLNLAMSVRDSEVFTYDPVTCQQIVLRDKTGKQLRMLRQVKQKLVDAALENTNEEAVMMLNGALRAFRAKTFLGLANDANKAKFGLDQPEWTLSIYQTEWNPETRQEKILEKKLLFSKMTDDQPLHALLAGSDAIFVAPKAALKAMIRGFDKAPAKPEKSKKQSQEKAPK